MKKNYVWKAIKIVFLIAVAIHIMGFVVMLLWNWLVPELFGIRAVEMHEAIGILVLSKLLFGGFKCGFRGGCHGACDVHHKGWKAKMHSRMENMSEEERMAFKKKLGKCCNTEDQSTKTE